MQLIDSGESREIDVIRMPGLDLDKKYFVGAWVNDALLVKGAYNTLEELEKGYGYWVGYTLDKKIDIPSVFEHENGEIRDINVSQDNEVLGLVGEVLKEKMGFNEVRR